MKLFFGAKTQGDEPIVDAQAVEALRKHTNKVTLTMGEFVLRSGDPSARAFLSQLQSSALSLPSKQSVKKIGEFSKQVCNTAAQFADEQRESVEKLISDLGSAMAEAITTLHDAGAGASETTSDITVLKDQIQRVDNAQTLDEAKQLLAKGVEAITSVLARQVERESSLKQSFQACTEKLEVQLQQARQESRTDTLTKLGNRAAFEQAALRYLIQAGESGKVFSLAMLDLDGFKQINDTQGHAAGDATLIAFSQRLSAATSSDAYVSRLGGDEFAVLCSSRAKHLEGMLHSLHESLQKRPVFHNGVALSVGTSYGVVEANGNQTLEQLCEAADRKMYAMKKQSKSRAA